MRIVRFTVPCRELFVNTQVVFPGGGGDEARNWCIVRISPFDAILVALHVLKGMDLRELRRDDPAMLIGSVCLFEKMEHCDPRSFGGRWHAWHQVLGDCRWPAAALAVLGNADNCIPGSS